MTCARLALSLLALIAHVPTADAQVTFAPLGEPIAPAFFPRAIALVDHDGDGDQDLITTRWDDFAQPTRYELYLHRRGPLGDFAPEELLGTGQTTRNLTRLIVEDFDGDGALDAVVASESGPVFFHRGTPAGTFLPRTVLVPGNARVWAIASGDVDLDGDLDLVLVRELVDRIVIVRNEFNPFGGFLREVFAPMTGASRDLALDDLNGDGRLDLVLLRPDIDRIEIRLGAGNDFGPLQTIPVDSPGRLVIADVVGDDGPDLVVSGEFGRELWQFENVQNATSWHQTLIDDGDARVLGLEVADMNGDGLLDIIGTRETADTAVVFSNDGTGAYERRAFEASNFGTFAQGILIEDLDQDGRMDILFARSNLLTTGGSRELLGMHQLDAVGAPFCPGTPNSTGSAATATLHGSDEVAANTLVLRVEGTPIRKFGIFAASRSNRAPYVPVGASGAFCLGVPTGGGVGRVRSDAGGFFLSEAEGSFQHVLDLAQLPDDVGTSPAVVGETWFFQAWFRDDNGGAATSNFSSGVSITFR